jgi:cytidine deaminase
MNYLPEDSAQQLLDEASRAAMHTYSPYSHFAVGAAVLAGDGAIYHGANAENASYGLTICAERMAIGAMLAAGNTGIRAIAVWAGTDSISPCGACRQFIIEFGKDIVVVFMQQQQLMQRTIGELLPYEFSKKTME